MVARYTDLIMRKLTLIMLVLAIAVPAFAETLQKPGKWQIRMQMDMPGMPFKMPPITTEVCLTEDDIKDPQKALPGDPKNPCTISDYKIEGNTVTWTADCPKQKTKGKGEITFTDNSYTGSMKMQVEEQEMTMKYSGQWKGACKK